MRLNVRLVKPNDQIFSQFERQLNSKPAIYHIPNASDVKTRVLTKDVKTISISNFFSSEKVPDRIVFALVPHQTYLGSLKSIPTVFEPHGLEEISLTHQNQTIRYKTDFDNGFYMDLYIALATLFKHRHEQCAPNIKYSKIPKAYALFPFDLTPFKDTSERNSGTHAVQLDLKFKNFLTDSLQLLYYTEFSRTFMITKERELVNDVSLNQ